MRPIRPRAPALFVVFPMLVLGTSACRTPPAKADEPPLEAPSVPVRLANVARGPVSRPIRGTGALRSKSEVDLSFKVGGVVSSVLVEEGATIKRGQVLARLDPTEVAASVRQATDAKVKAERDLERVRRLHASGALPQATLDDAVTNASLANAALDSASFNANRSVIVAPDDGRVDKRAVEPGEIVSPGRAVFHVSGRSKGAVVRFGVSGRDALRLREGDVAHVTVDALKDASFPAKVTQIATVATAGAGTFDVEVKLDEPPAGLLSGLTAKVEIDRTEPASATIPVTALTQGRSDDASVFVVDQGRAKRVPVKIAFLHGGRAVLAKGLESDNQVVEAGVADLDDGTRLRVVP